MGEFKLDTSGSVSFRLHGLMQTKIWSDLSPLAQGYTEALFEANEQALVEAYAAIGQSEPWGHPDQAKLAYTDLAGETVARIIEDCAAGPDRRSAGSEFWRLRQLGQFPHKFPPLTVSLGDDGRMIYLSNASQSEGVQL